MSLLLLLFDKVCGAWASDGRTMQCK